MSATVTAGRSVVSEVWHRAIGVQPVPATSVVVGMALLAAACVLVPGLWSASRNVVTIAHEGTHAFVAVLTGRRLSGVRLHMDTSGVTLSRGKPSGLGLVAMFASGYVGPGLLGLASAWLLGQGHAVGLLWLVLVLLVLLFVWIRNVYGLLLVLVVGFAVFAVSWWGSAALQAACAYAITWFLLLAAPRPVIELQRARRRGRAHNSDADLLARVTHVPGLVWVSFFFVGTVGSLMLGSRLLLRGL